MDAKERLLRDKIKYVNLLLGKGGKHTYQGEDVLPLLPFQMYLLKACRDVGGVAPFARRVNRDEEQIRRWCQGYYWERDCEPRPIHGVTIGTVYEVLFQYGHPEDLYLIYPFIDH